MDSFFHPLEYKQSIYAEGTSNSNYFMFGINDSVF